MIRFHLLLLALLGCVAALADDLASGLATNVPPPSKLFIVGNGSADFLGFTNVYLTRRTARTVALETHLGADHDDEGELLYFYWYDGATVASEFPRYTNDYTPGLHTIRVAVTDNRELLDLHFPLEVVSPLDAMRRLRADLELTGVYEDIARLRPHLRLAHVAIRRHAWSVAQRRLERFQRRLSVHLDGETGPTLIERWDEATRRIIQSIRPIRRGSAFPGGIFPGP